MNTVFGEWKICKGLIYETNILLNLCGTFHGKSSQFQIVPSTFW